MPIACPCCRNEIEVMESAALSEIACPACGSAFHLDTGSTAAWDPGASQRKLGKFELLEIVGIGGFGTVYRARDPELDRIVAIKIPRAGNLATTQDIDRFLREARSVAQLHHPAIVSVHEVGQAEGMPYLVEDFVEGITLADLLSGRRPVPHEAAQLTAAVADALQYAHDMGVVHRDVKPSNIMLEMRDEGRGPKGETEELTAYPLASRHSPLIPRLMDFGLAKRDGGEITVTMDGQVLGTPAYMSPEQARGEAHKVDGRSDVYSLGVILYQMVTGELPFRGTTRMLLHQVLHDEPRRPRSLNDRIPRDLETISLKAMAKEPGRRYQSARELADDLRRFVKGEPIQARPLSTWERCWNWARRRPALAGLLLTSAVAVLALVGVVTGLIYNSHLQEALGEAERQKDLAETYKYFHHIARAHMELRDGNVGRVEPLLDDAPAAHRHWEWSYLKRLCHADLLTLEAHRPAGVFGVAFNPDGALLASTADNSTVKVWNAGTGQEIRSLKGHKGIVWGVVFSPDGTRIATAGTDHTVKLWDVAGGQELQTLKGHTDVVRGVAFSPDGAHLASAGADRTVRVWDAITGEAVHVHEGYTKPFRAVAFHPDGSMLAAASEDRTVKVWKTNTRKPLYSLKGHTGYVTALAFSPDGARLASGAYDNTVKLWEMTGREVRTLKGHTGYVRGLAFSPDGKQLASTGADQSAKVWNVQTGQEIFALKGHKAEAVGVAFSPDGSRLASTSADGTVRLWSATVPQEILTLTGHSDGVRDVAFSPDGKQLVSAGLDQVVRIWEIGTRQELRSLRGHSDEVHCVARSPDGKQVAAGARDGRLIIWDAATGKAALTLNAHKSGVLPGLSFPKSGLTCLVFSPDGQKLASAGSDGFVKLWDPTAGQELLSYEAHKGPVFGLAFSPDGRRLASGGKDSMIKVCDATSGRQIRAFRAHGVWVWNVAFSPDGTMLASAGWDNHATIWDAASGRPIHPLPHSTDVWGVAFSPDNKRLATTSSDQTVKIWDTATGQEALSLRGHIGIVWNVAFSPDGNRLASASEDQTVKIWDASPLGAQAAFEREALGLVEFLFAKPLSKSDVIEYLKSAKTVRPQARQLALSLVPLFRETTAPDRFYQAGWDIAARPHLNAFQYRFALLQADTACRLVPNRATYLFAVGAAKFRLGNFEEALATLAKADQLQKDFPAGLAFLAMTQHRLGRLGQARATFTRLDVLVKMPLWSGDPVVQALSREARATLRNAMQKN